MFRGRHCHNTRSTYWCLRVELLQMVNRRRLEGKSTRQCYCIFDLGTDFRFTLESGVLNWIEITINSP